VRNAIATSLPTHQDLGCQRPFPLTYKARLLTQSAKDREDLRGFLEAYRKTGQQLATFLAKWFGGGPTERVAACLLVCPKHVPPDVLDSAGWQAVSKGETDGFLPKKWPHLIENTLYQNLRALAGRDERPTKAGVVVQKIWTQFNLRAPTGAEFDRLFGLFAAETWRSEAAIAVQGALRSYFSLNELVRREEIARNIRRAALHAQAPGFFNWLSLWLEDIRGFVQACRLLQPIRRELIAENVDRAVLRACQSTALLQRLDARALWPRLVDSSMSAIVAAHPTIVTRIAAGIPTPFPSLAVTEPDSIRRFCSAAHSVEWIAREPGFIKEILRAIQRERLCDGTQEFESMLNDVQQHGSYFRHAGWLRLCRSGDKKVVALVNDAREYARLLRPVSQAELKADAEFWPMLPFGQRIGWEPARAPDNSPANTAALAFDIPAYASERDGKTVVSEQRSVTVLLRGHLPTNGTESLEKQLDVKAGLFQFRPDRRKTIFGQHPQATKRWMYLKPQSLRLVEDRAGLAGAWTTLHMAETPLLPSKEHPLHVALQPGDRMGVIIVLPGGTVLCDLLVFERTAGGHGWKLVVVEETRARTDRGMKKGSKRGNPQPWVCKRRPFVRIDAAAVDVRLAHLLTDAERQPTPDVEANRKITSWKGRVRTALGDTAYKQIAARIERLLSWNQCKGVLIAGGGYLRGQTRLQHPFQRFYGAGTRSGFLVNAVNRLGLPWSATTARPARIWMKSYLDAPNAVSELQLGHVFRRLRQDERAGGKTDGAAVTATRGSVTHIALNPSGDHAVDLPINAGWAVLLAWANPAFNKLAAKALESSDDSES